MELILRAKLYFFIETAKLYSDYFVCFGFGFGFRTKFRPRFRFRPRFVYNSCVPLVASDRRSSASNS